MALTKVTGKGIGAVDEITSDTAGTNNFVAGVNAGNSIASGGNDNTCVGDEAGTAITTGDNSVAIGYRAGDAITTGSSNIAIGRDALGAEVAGNKNIAIGAGALETQSFSSSTDAYNIAIGDNAGLDLTDGQRNILVGGLAGEEITDADDNIAIGYRSGGGGAGSATTGHDNVSIGTDAGEVLTSGSQNTLIGRDAGDAIITGQGNICIGHGATTATSNRVFSITMGRDVASVGDYYFTFGVDSAVHRVYNQFTSNASWTRQSDERIKKDITTNTDCGLDFINDLRTVTYKFKAPSELDSSMAGYDESKTESLYNNKMYGFIAQEVKSAMDTHNITDFSGWHQVDDGGDNMQGISYEMFVMPLVKAVQELSAKNDALEARITALENE